MGRCPVVETERLILRPFREDDLDALYSVILPENTRSQAVAKRLGFTLFETRVLSHFPSAPHDIWRLERSR